jgi:hypothetical protein
VEEAKQNLLAEETKYSLRFSITPHFDPFIQMVA